MVAAMAKKTDAEWLKHFIDSAGWTRREASELFDISERMLRYYISGERPIPITVLWAFEHYLCCDSENIGKNYDGAPSKRRQAK